MSAQYTIGQVLSNGATVVSDTYTLNPDGSSFEQMIDSDGNGLNITVPSPSTQASNAALQQANANIQSLLGAMAPALAQAQVDLTTLQNSNDPLAPILARTVSGTLTVVQAIEDILTALQIIPTG